mmetsp:Transcript_35269/g.76528  ORF Transcript_35269/g.76528 Transcript_35269/m.76528 type:complete len:840 (+) Transcript_35269:277-2796(+)
MGVSTAEDGAAGGGGGGGIGAEEEHPMTVGSPPTAATAATAGAPSFGAPSSSSGTAPAGTAAAHDDHDAARAVAEDTISPSDFSSAGSSSGDDHGTSSAAPGASKSQAASSASASAGAAGAAEAAAAPSLAAPVSRSPTKKRHKSTHSRKSTASRGGTATTGVGAGVGVVAPLSSLGRDGRDYDHHHRHLDSSGSVGGNTGGSGGGGRLRASPRRQQQQEKNDGKERENGGHAPRLQQKNGGSSNANSKWRPPTPPSSAFQQRNKGSLLDNLGGDDSNTTDDRKDKKSSSSWLGSLFFSSRSGNNHSAEASANNGDDVGIRSSSSTFSALDDGSGSGTGSGMGIHPEELATTAAILASRSSGSTKKRSRLVRGRGRGGTKKRGDRQLLQQHDYDDDVDDNDDEFYNDNISDFEHDLRNNNIDSSSSRGSRSNGTDAEEKVRDECSFFYTGLDDDPQTKRAELMLARQSSPRFGAKTTASAAPAAAAATMRRGGRRMRRGNLPRFGGAAATGEGDYHHHGGDLYYAATGEDGAMALDIESASGYYDHEERDAFLARYESLNAHIDATPSRSRTSRREIHTAILPGHDHDLRLEEGKDDDHDYDYNDSSSSSSVYSSAMSSLHSMVGGFGAGGSSEPPSPRSMAIRSDSLRQSSLMYINAESGMVQLRLPNDNVKLLMDPHLVPGILSVEKFAPSGDCCRGGGGSVGRKRLPDMPRLGTSRSQDEEFDEAALESYPSPPSRKKLLDEDDLEKGTEAGDENDAGINGLYPWQESELSYVLTVDEDLYRRLVKEMADSKTLCGLYYCCHQTEGDENRPRIGIALCVLFVVFTLLLVETIIHPH